MASIQHRVSQWEAVNWYNKWLQIHPQFYAYAFTARSKATAWCPVCHLNSGNYTYDCPMFNLLFSLALFPTLAHSTLPQPLLHLPYSIPHLSSSHAYPRQNVQNLTTACKGSCLCGADCKFTHKCTYTHCFHFPPTNLKPHYIKSQKSFLKENKCM